MYIKEKKEVETMLMNIIAYYTKSCDLDPIAAAYTEEDYAREVAQKVSSFSYVKYVKITCEYPRKFTKCIYYRGKLVYESICREHEKEDF